MGCLLFCVNFFYIMILKKNGSYAWYFKKYYVNLQSKHTNLLKLFLFTN